MFRILHFPNKVLQLAEDGRAKTLGLRDICGRVILVLVGGGTLYGGEGVIGPGPRPPGPAPISARGPLAHTRGGPDQRAGAGPSTTRPAPSTL